MATSADPCPIIVVNLAESFGALLGGVFLSLLFYGAALVQTFFYFRNCSKDGWILKGLVLLVLSFDTVHQFLTAVGIWGYLVTNFGNFANLGQLHVPFVLQILFSELCGTCVQFFFLWRIWIFSNKKWFVPAVFTGPILLQPILTAYYVGKALSNDTVPELAKLSEISTVINGFTTAVDLALSACLFLLLALGRTGFSRSTDRIIIRLMTISVNTGTWTAIAALLTAILVRTSPTTLIYGWPNTPLASLYLNTLLGNLNAREYVTSGSNSNHGSSGAPVMSSTLPPVSFTHETKHTLNSSVGTDTMTLYADGSNAMYDISPNHKV